MCNCSNLKGLVFFILSAVFFTGLSQGAGQEEKFLSDNSKKFAVETVKGVPMITIDGQPVRGRIFWGRTDCGNLITAGPKRQTIDFEYVPRIDAQKIGTIHFRFGKNPGTVALDDFSIIEMGSGKKIAGPYSFDTEKDFTDHWKVFHTNVQKVPVAEAGIKTVGKNDSNKELVLTILKSGTSVKHDFHLYHKHELDLRPDKKYRVRFTIASDKPRSVSIEFYRPENPYLNLESKRIVKKHLVRQVQLAANADVNFISFLFRDCWPQEDGSYDWSILDEICDTILAANPKALLLPRPGMNAPKWWLDKNPEERMIWKDVKPFHLEFGNQWASPASLKYRKAACEALAAMIRHMEEKYGSSVAGYHPYGQNTGEWFTVNTWGAGLSGFGIAEGNSWRRWLGEKYRTDTDLQKAWGNSGVTLQSAVVPSAELRRKSMSAPFLDPGTDPEHQALIDFNLWTQKEMTDTILALAKTIRETTNGKKLSLFFYGYSFEFSGVSKGPAASAHYNLRALLNSPDIDLICSPMSYSDRQPGGGGSCMLTAESVTAAGKIYLYEDDTRTCLAQGSNSPGSESGSDSLLETQNLLLRNTAESAVRNFSAWWMDLGGTGWFEDARLWDVMCQIKNTDEYFINNPVPYRPEIGVFLDEGSVLKISAGKYSSKMIGLLRQPLNRLGTSYGQYLLDDLTSGRIGAPKLSLVLNPKCLSDEQLRIIREKTKGASLLFVDLNGLGEDTLRQAAKKAKVHLYTDVSCNVWANGPYAVLHAAQDGTVHFTARHDNSIYDAITGKKLSDNGHLTLDLKKGETKVLFEQ